MRKVLLSLLVLALAAPTFAAVNISGVDNQDGTVTLAIDTTSGEVVRGVALKVAAADGAKLVQTAATVNPVFNTFIDSAFELGGAYNIGDGHPFANAAAAGTADVVNALEFSISMGVLDQAGNQAGYTSPVGGEALITFKTGAGTLTITLDTLRGGIVGDAAIVSNLDTAAVVVIVTDGPQDAIKAEAPFYAAWVQYGKPACWAYAKNCKGDADGLKQGTTKQGFWHVGTGDLNVLLAAWEVKESATGTTPSGPGILSVTNGICADFARDIQGTTKQGFWRVGTNDLNILLASWEVKEPATGTTPSGPGLADCTPEHYNFYMVP
jgi:hypothetical protein